MKQVINNLKKLDLDKCSDNDIRNLLSQMGKIPACVRDLHEGAVIYRASILREGEKVKNVNRLSYCPPECNKNYQRASTPMQTMFYGVVGNQFVDNRMNCEVLALQETCPFLRDSVRKDGTYQVAVSHWNVLNTISLMSLMNPDNTNKSERLNEMAKELQSFIKQNRHIVNEEDAFCFHRFMCNQFTKSVNNNKYYRISAFFTMEILEHNIDGVIWESSVAIDEHLKETLCVAIKPDGIDNFTECASEYSLYTITIKDGQVMQNPLIPEQKSLNLQSSFGASTDINKQKERFINCWQNTFGSLPDEETVNEYIRRIAEDGIGGDALKYSEERITKIKSDFIYSKI